MKKILVLFLCLFISTRTLSATTWDNAEFWDYTIDKQKITVNDVKEKLSEGWNINAKTTKYPQETLLMYAVKNNNIEIAEFLLKNGANVNEKNENGITALFYAKKDKKVALPMWQLLLKYGANINILDKNSKSILVHETASSGSADFMEFLVENGIKVDNTNIKEHPLFYLFYSGSSDPNDSLYKQRKLDLLLKAGADINVQNLRGQTPLMFTAKYNPTFLKLLLERGADPTILDDKGKNALTYLPWQKPEYVRLLTNTKAKIKTAIVQAQERETKGVIRNPNISSNIPKCASPVGREMCVYYILNDSPYDQYVEDFFDEVSRLTARSKQSLLLENPAYERINIPPGRKAEIKVPELR